MYELKECDHNVIKLHGKNFSEEIQYFLTKNKMTQKELATRLGISTKHVNSILNDEVVDVSVSVLEGLEYAFGIPAGLLTKIYHKYTNIRMVEENKNIKADLNAFGIDFLTEHPELSIPFGITIDENMDLYLKLMRLKKFYGVSNLNNYRDYLFEHVLAESKKYLDKPNFYIWIRFCELSVDKLNDNVGIFRNSVFELLMKKVLNIMSNENVTFSWKIKLIKKFLLQKGIVLVTKHSINNNLIRGITLKKGRKRYIFLSDVFHSEPFIFFALLHELVHCFFSDYDEENIDKKVISEYKKWEEITQSNYKHIYDVINYYNQIQILTKKNKLDSLTKKTLFETLIDKYDFVSFEDEENENA